MRICNHIAFRADTHSALFEYLANHNIPIFQGSILTSFDIMSDDPCWYDVKDILLRNNISFVSKTEYSQEELLAAKWLTVRSQWRNGYPQPEPTFGYRTISYSDKEFCPQCGSGLEQVNPFRMKKSPAWGTRHFMMLNWIDDELFVDDVVKTSLEGSELSGYVIRNVLNKQGTSQLPGVYQLGVQNILPNGIIWDRSSIDRIDVCSSCGLSKYHPTGIGMLAYRAEVFDNAPDIIKTSELFGWGKAASRRVVISSKVYRFITQHNLGRGLVFEPIEVVGASDIEAQ